MNDGPRKQRYANLVERHFGDLVRFALWLTHDREVAEDLVQETLLRAWRRLDQLRDAKAVKPWLLTTLRRENARRFERRRLDTVDLDKCQLADEQGKPEDQILVDQLRTAVHRLPANYREPLALQVLKDCSIAEVANRLDLTESAVMTRVFRARQQIRERFLEPASAA